MRSGRLRMRLALERPVQTKNPTSGGTMETWELVQGGIPAEKSALTAREFIAAQAVQSQITGKIVMRWMDGITANMRLRDELTGQVYNIAGALPDTKTGRRYLTIPVSEGVNHG